MGERMGGRPETDGRGGGVNSLSLQRELADADEVLCDFGETLFALVPDITWPVDEVLVNLLQGFLVVLIQLHLDGKTISTV